MASTLTFAMSQGPAQSAATALGYMNDLNSMVTANAANAAFSWAVGQFNTAGNPYYLTLVQKSNLPTGGNPAPVILVAIYTSALSHYNTDVCDALPTTGVVQIAYFPVATTSTPSNLAPGSTGSSAVMGSDTNCIKFANAKDAITTGYSAGYQQFYFDSIDYVLFGMGETIFDNSDQGNFRFWSAGLNLVDWSGNVYASCWNGLSPTQKQLSGVGTITQWSASAQSASASTINVIRTNYSATNSIMGDMWLADTTNGIRFFLPGANSVGTPQDGCRSLLPGAVPQAYFCPIPILGMTKGQGPTLKYRQLALGPETLSAFELIYTSGSPSATVAATAAMNNIAGGSAMGATLWVTNFQV